MSARRLTASTELAAVLAAHGLIVEGLLREWELEQMKGEDRAAGSFEAHRLLETTRSELAAERRAVADKEAERAALWNANHALAGELKEKNFELLKLRADFEDSSRRLDALEATERELGPVINRQLRAFADLTSTLHDAARPYAPGKEDAAVQRIAEVVSMVFGDVKDDARVAAKRALKLFAHELIAPLRELIARDLPGVLEEIERLNGTEASTVQAAGKAGA